MSKIIQTKADKEKIVDMCLILLQHLTFHAIPNQQQTAVIEHFLGLRKEKRELLVDCQLATEDSGRTIINIVLTPAGIVPRAAH